jgi:hypothetical protein
MDGDIDGRHDGGEGFGGYGAEAEGAGCEGERTRVSGVPIVGGQKRDAWGVARHAQTCVVAPRSTYHVCSPF